MARRQLRDEAGRIGWKSMLPALDNLFGNPSSVHEAGRLARNALDEARRQVAALVNVHARQVIFTGGGTESDNLAVKGILWARRAADPAPPPGVAPGGAHHAVDVSVPLVAPH